MQGQAAQIPELTAMIDDLAREVEQTRASSSACSKT